MRIISFVLLIAVNVFVIAQDKYILPTELFEWKAGVTQLDTINKFSVWQTQKSNYENGRKKEETRIFITEGCKKNVESECSIKFQHQKFYDDSLSTVLLKEGKYMLLKNGKGVYKSYYWDYNHEGKLMSKEKSKTKLEELIKD
jgi:hypothetical protein